MQHHPLRAAAAVAGATAGAAADRFAARIALLLEAGPGAEPAWLAEDASAARRQLALRIEGLRAGFGELLARAILPAAQSLHDALLRHASGFVLEQEPRPTAAEPRFGLAVPGTAFRLRWGAGSAQEAPAPTSGLPDARWPRLGFALQPCGVVEVSISGRATTLVALKEFGSGAARDAFEALLHRAMQLRHPSFLE